MHVFSHPCFEEQAQLGGCFTYFLMFTPIWGRFPFWLIFFKGVGNHQLDSTRRWWISTHQLRSWCTKKPTSSSHGELLGRVRQRHNFKALGMRIYMNLLYAILSKSRNGAIHHFLSGHECHQMPPDATRVFEGLQRFDSSLLCSQCLIQHRGRCGETHPRKRMAKVGDGWTWSGWSYPKHPIILSENGHCPISSQHMYIYTFQ